MKKIIYQLNRMSHERLLSRLKHLRGQHDQLDHAWNRGMGQGGYGAGLAPNQMGPLPTQSFYRQRLADLTAQRRRGEITRAEMRQQMRDLRGITAPESDSNLILANANEPYISPDLVSAMDAKRQLQAQRDRADKLFFIKRDKRLSNLQQAENTIDIIRAFSDARSAERLPMDFDIEAYMSQLKEVGYGISKVQYFKKDGKKYFYRGTPAFKGSPDFPTDSNKLWSLLRGPLKGLAADNIASAIGLPLAPIAQKTINDLVVTNALKLKRNPNGDQWFNYTEQLKDAYENNPSAENYFRWLQFVEPLVMMDLIIGQNDGHSGNIDVVANPNKKLYDSDYIATSVDYDLSGENDLKSLALFQWSEIMYRHANSFNNNILTPDMRNILSKFSQTIQWNENIPKIARQQFEKRVQALLHADKHYSLTDLRFNSNSEYDVADAMNDIVNNASSAVTIPFLDVKIELMIDSEDLLRQLRDLYQESRDDEFKRYPEFTKMAEQVYAPQGLPSIKNIVNRGKQLEQETIRNESQFIDLKGGNQQYVLSLYNKEILQFSNEVDKLSTSINNIYGMVTRIRRLISEKEMQKYKNITDKIINTNILNAMQFASDYAQDIESVYTQFDGKWNPYDNALSFQLENNVEDIIKESIVYAKKYNLLGDLMKFLDDYYYDFVLKPPYNTGNLTIKNRAVRDKDSLNIFFMNLKNTLSL